MTLKDQLKRDLKTHRYNLGHLAEIAEVQKAIEINSSYYRIPSASMFERMEQKTPAGFEFVVKLFRGMTPEKLARAKAGHGMTKGAVEGVKSYKVLGNALLLSGPVIAGAIVWVALGLEG